MVLFHLWHLPNSDGLCLDPTCFIFYHRNYKFFLTTTKQESEAIELLAPLWLFITGWT